MTKWIVPKEVFDYSKETSEIIVQPLTIKGVEKFSVYNVAEKKFYREEEKIIVDGEEREVNKYIKLTDEQKKTWRRSLKVSREIIYDDEEYTYDMPPSLNEQLEQIMDTIRELGQNPLEKQYVIIRKKTGDKAWDVEYSVKIHKTNSVMSEEPEISLDEPEEITLSDVEQKYVTAIIKQYPDHSDTGNYAVGTWADLLKKKIGVTEGRAQSIEQQFLR